MEAGAAVDAAEQQLPRIEFDRQPRAVDYKPYSLREYQDCKQDAGYWTLGTLGPDFQQHPEWRAKVEKQQRARNFGVAASQNNRERIAAASMEPRPAPRAPGAEMRERMRSYANSIPRPPHSRTSSSSAADAADAATVHPDDAAAAGSQEEALEHSLAQVTLGEAVEKGEDSEAR